MVRGWTCSPTASRGLIPSTACGGVANLGSEQRDNHLNARYSTHQQKPETPSKTPSRYMKKTRLNSSRGKDVTASKYLFQKDPITYGQSGSPTSAKGNDKKRDRYLMGFLAGTKDPSDLVASWVDDGHQRQFLAHLLGNGMLSPRWFSDEQVQYVPICHDLIPGGRATVDALVKKNLISVDWRYVQPRNGKPGRSRQYRVQDWVMSSYITTALDDESTTKYNMVTGKRARSQAQGHDEGGTPFGIVYYDRAILLAGLEALRKLALACPTERNRARARVAEKCVYTMTKSRTAKHRPDVGLTIWSYVPRYVESSSGRKCEVGGGAQGLPGDLKLSLNVVGTWNYDLEAAQAMGFLKILSVLNAWHGYNWRRRGIKCRRLEQYLAMDRAGKMKLAETLGISYDLLKVAVFSVLFGASDSYLTGGYVFDGKRMVYREGIKDGDEPLSPESQKALVEFLRPIKACSMEVSSRLTTMLTEIVERSSMTGIGTGLQAWARKVMNITVSSKGVHITNAADSTIKVMDVDGKWSVDEDGRKMYPGRIVSHCLQGLECNFLDTLLIGLVKAGVTVGSLQFDGLTTIGEIPKGVLARATSCCALGTLARLKSGPFAPKKERQARAVQRHLDAQAAGVQRQLWRAAQLKLQQEQEQAVADGPRLFEDDHLHPTMKVVETIVPVMSIMTSSFQVPMRC